MASVYDVPRKNTLTWSPKSLRLSKILEKFKNQLPVFVKVEEGIYETFEMRTFSPDEVYKIHGTHTETKVLADVSRETAEDNVTRLIIPQSFQGTFTIVPANSHAHENIYTITPGTSEFTIKEILEEPTLKIPLKVKIHTHNRSDFAMFPYLDVTQSVFSLESVFEETYAVTSRTIGNKWDFHVIPADTEVNFFVAELSENPVCEIRADITSAIELGPLPIDEPYVKFQLKQKQSHAVKAPQYHDQMHVGDDPPIYEIMAPNFESMYEEIPPTYYRHSIAVPTEWTGSNVHYGNSVVTAQGRLRRHSIQNTDTGYSENVNQDQSRPAVLPLPEPPIRRVGSLADVRRSATLGPNRGLEESETRNRRRRPLSARFKSKVSAFKNMFKSETASSTNNLTFTSLSVQDVAEILRYDLRFEERKVQKFVDMDVDGALLLRIDEDILCRDFDLSPIQARKLSVFVHENWRPKTNTSMC